MNLEKQATMLYKMTLDPQIIPCQCLTYPLST